MIFLVYYYIHYYFLKYIDIFSTSILFCKVNTLKRGNAASAGGPILRYTANREHLITCNYGLLLEQITKICLFVYLGFNATFNYILVMLQRSVLLVEEAGVPVENHHLG